MKKTLLIIAAVCISAASFAQNSAQNAYFLDGYTYCHDLNPSFATERSYLALPAVGSMNVSIKSNLGVSTFLYPMETGGVTTFLNPSISTDQFLKKLNKRNTFDVGLNTKILSVGAWNKKSTFTSFDINLKSNTGLSLPYDLFGILKTFGAQDEYSFSNLGVGTDNYLEVALGQSRNIGNHLRVGAKVKVLVGIANARVNVDNATITMSEDLWSARLGARAELAAGNNLIDIPTRPGGQFAIDDIELNEPAGVGDFLNGFGLAFDLGASYRMLDNKLTLSASLLDLGLMHWKDFIEINSQTAYFDFDGFGTVTSDELKEMDLGDRFSSLGDGFKNMDQLDLSARGGNSRLLHATLNLGAEYQVVKILSAGLLFTTQAGPVCNWTETRLSANFKPAGWFSASLSGAVSTLGPELGFGFNLHNRVFTLFVNANALSTRYTAPINADGVSLQLPVGPLKGDVNFGLILNLSKKRSW